jgi:O-antigen ligase
MPDPLPTMPTRSPAEVRAAWACALAVIVLPFVANLPVDFDRFAPLIFLPAIWFARQHLVPSNVDPKPETTDRWLLGFALAAAILAILLGSRPAPSIVAAANWLLVLGGAIAARRASVSAQATRLLFAGISCGAAVACLAIWMGWQQGTPAHVFPHYGHVRLFGLHMMIGCAAALGWWMTAKSLNEKKLAGLIAIVTCSGMFWSGGRAPVVAIAAGIGVWIYFAQNLERRLLARRAALMIAAGLLLSALKWTPESYLGWWSAAARSSAATNVDELSSSRLSFWTVAWEHYLDSPWTGHGPDAYRFIRPKQDGSQPHNWPLQLLLDVGIVGALPFGALLARQAYRGLRASDASPAEPPVNPRRAAAAAFVTCLIGGLLDGVFYHAVLLMPAALLAGVAGRTDTLTRVDASRLFRPVLAALFIISLSALSVHTFLIFRLWIAAPPAAHSWIPRVLQEFPSSVTGIERWLRAWDPSQPHLALAWARWAQRHSDVPERLHVYAALLELRLENVSAARKEIRAAIDSAHRLARPRLQQTLNALETQPTSGDSAATAATEASAATRR